MVALTNALVDHIADHDPAGEVRPRNVRKRARGTGLQRAQIARQAAFVTLEDCGHHRQRIRLPTRVVPVVHRSRCTSFRNDWYAATNESGSSPAELRTSFLSSIST